MEKLKEIIDIFHKEIDRAFVWWQVISWALLLGGFAMLVFSYSVSDNPSFLMEFGGLISVIVSIFNFIASLLVGALYVTKGVKSRSKAILLKRVSVIGGYLVLAIIIFIVSFNVGYLI